MISNKKPKKPLNFIDLRNSSTKNRPTLIQDIFPNEMKPRWFRSLSEAKRLSKTQLILSIIVVVVVIALGLKVFTPPYNPVPISIRKAVNFQIYYPNPNNLPKGYILDISSFSAGNNAVLYTVKYGNNQKLVFTEQLKPSAAALQAFKVRVIPLNTTIVSNIGTSTIGAANGETVVSLPTNSKTWILVTAPFNTPQKQLDQVLRAF